MSKTCSIPSPQPSPEGRGGQKNWRFAPPKKGARPSALPLSYTSFVTVIDLSSEAGFGLLYERGKTGLIKYGYVSQYFTIHFYPGF